MPTYVLAWSPLNAIYETIRPKPEDVASLPPGGIDVKLGALPLIPAVPEAYTWGEPVKFDRQPQYGYGDDKSTKAT